MTSAETATKKWRPVDSLSNRLRLMRADLDLSQRQAADAIGVTPRIWQGMEEGRTPRGLQHIITAISAVWDVDRDWLMWGGPLDEEAPTGPVGPGGGAECARRDSNPKPSVVRIDDYRRGPYPLVAAS